MSQEKIEDMNIRSLWAMILSHVNRHGLSFLILTGIVLYFHSQNSLLDNRILECNKNTIELYQIRNEQLMQVIERNSRAMESLGDYLDRKKTSIQN